ncbi:hypothetical protein P7K49_017378 [Saguinus oedipus]|uniref:PH domain-containing protein n=1 Tax=Saguinus oedipus TaxID=9490 RepID=A0ABQ9V507_SAGOE|nr:hypothetical protein P7K49_017378 [Saguinus oedipus]
MPGAGARAEEGDSGGGEGAAQGAAPELGAGTVREPARLCGYLQKLSGKGPLRGYRTRWFVFDARRCYLYYFKSPQDALPLGHLDIADACFSYQGPDEAAEPGAEPPAHFQVHTAGAVTVLKVGPRAPLPTPRFRGRPCLGRAPAPSTLLPPRPPRPCPPVEVKSLWWCLVLNGHASATEPAAFLEQTGPWAGTCVAECQMAGLAVAWRTRLSSCVYPATSLPPKLQAAVCGSLKRAHGLWPELISFYANCAPAFSSPPFSPVVPLSDNAPNRQLMTYWLQELQQKRWEYCNSLDMVKWDSRTSPTPGDFPKGLVARDNTVNENEFRKKVIMMDSISQLPSTSVYEAYASPVMALESDKACAKHMEEMI